MNGCNPTPTVKRPSSPRAATEYSWGDRHLPLKLRPPPATGRPRIDTNCVSGHMRKALLAETRVPPAAYRNARCRANEEIAIDDGD